MTSPETEAEVLQFPARQMERINDILIDLGRMSLLELQLLEVQCQKRFMEAHTDLTITRDTIARRYPEEAS